MENLVPHFFSKEILNKIFTDDEKNWDIMGDAVLQLICMDTIFYQLSNYPFHKVKSAMVTLCSRQRIRKIGVKLGLISFLNDKGISLYYDNNLDEIKAIKILVGFYFKNEGYEKTKEWLKNLSINLETDSDIFIRKQIPNTEIKVIEEIEHIMQYTFVERKYLQMTFVNTNSHLFQSLSLLGEKVLNLLIANKLWKKTINNVVSVKITNRLVSNKMYSEIYKDQKLYKWFSEDKRNQKTWENDYIQSLFGAIFLDGGLSSCKNPFIHIVLPSLNKLIIEELNKEN